jgi:hypothetical protein
MNRLAARIAGFAVPTLGLITALHLGEQATWGEGLDGVVSGLWFTFPFAGACWLRSRLEGGRKSARARTPGHEFAFGFMAAVVAWTAVWYGWTLASSAIWRPHAFGINSAVTGLAGLLLPAAGRTSRGAGAPVSGEVATERT